MYHLDKVENDSFKRSKCFMSMSLFCLFFFGVLGVQDVGEKWWGRPRKVGWRLRKHTQTALTLFSGKFIEFMLACALFCCVSDKP